MAIFIFDRAKAEINDSLNYVHNALLGVDQNIIRSPAPIVDCYGDSNTLFYYGDTMSGQIQNAYSSFARVLSMQFSNISGADFVNMGTGGITAESGDAGFNTTITNSPHSVVIGFGTNNIKPVTRNLTTYLAAMESIVQKTLNLNAVPIVLTIPDFNDAYADDGVTGRQQIPIWNAALVKMVKKYNVQVLDIYSLFNATITDQHSIFYNEATNWRHLSAYSESIIAYKLCEILTAKSIFPSFKNYLKFGIALEDDCILSTTGTLVNQNVRLTNGGNSAPYLYNVIKITGTSLGSVNFRCSGDIITLGFYPRNANGIVNIKFTDPVDSSVIYETQFDTYGVITDNLYMPVKKFTYHSKKILSDFNVEVKATDTKNVSSSGTDIYFAGISAAKIYLN